MIRSLAVKWLGFQPTDRHFVMWFSWVFIAHISSFWRDLLFPSCIGVTFALSNVMRLELINWNQQRIVQGSTQMKHNNSKSIAANQKRFLFMLHYCSGKSNNLDALRTEIGFCWQMPMFLIYIKLPFLWHNWEINGSSVCVRRFPVNYVQHILIYSIFYAPSIYSLYIHGLVFCCG